MKRQLELKYRIALGVFVISSVLLIATSFIYYQMNEKRLIESERQSMHYYASDAAYHLNLELKDKITNALTISTAPLVHEYLMASNQTFAPLPESKRAEQIKQLNQQWLAADRDSPIVIERTTNPLAQFLKQQQQILPQVYGELFITNRYGAMVASTAKLTTLAHAHKYWWVESFDQGRGKIFLDDRGFDDSAQGYVIGVVVPIKHQGEIIGILKANVNVVDALGEVVKRFNQQQLGELIIARTKGLIVYRDSVEPLSTKLHRDELEYLQKNQSNTHIGEQNGVEILNAYVPLNIQLPGHNVGFGGKPQSMDHKGGNDNEIWHMVVHRPMSEVLKGSEALYQSMLNIGFLLLLMSAALAYFVGFSVSRKEQQLEQKLRDYNATLEHEVAQKTRENLIQTNLLQEQAKLAAMGEMVGAIAHQWRQPLNELMLRIQRLKYLYLKNEINESSIETFIAQNRETINFMSQTIDDFRNFFRVDKERKRFVISDAAHRVIMMLNEQFKNNAIHIEMETDESELLGYQTELQQALMNILSNSKDAFLEQKIKNRTIAIRIKDQVISIQDNAGGVSEQVLAKMFDAYYTTKGEGKGTGMGLYLVKKIVEENMQGQISARNHEQGLLIVIDFSGQ